MCKWKHQCLNYSGNWGDILHIHAEQEKETGTERQIGQTIPYGSRIPVDSAVLPFVCSNQPMHWMKLRAD